MNTAHDFPLAPHACAEPLDVWMDGGSLLTFDVRVLEIFGFTDAHRFHIAYSPRIELGENPSNPKKQPHLMIQSARGYFGSAFDPSRRIGFEQLDARLREATRYYATHGYVKA